MNFNGVDLVAEDAVNSTLAGVGSAAVPASGVVFALRVTATGARTYYLIYRSAGSEKKSFLWIGDAGRMSLAGARDRARAADRLRGQGSDPVAERKREERT